MSSESQKRAPVTDPKDAQKDWAVLQQELDKFTSKLTELVREMHSTEWLKTLEQIRAAQEELFEVARRVRLAHEHVDAAFRLQVEVVAKHGAELEKLSADARQFLKELPSVSPPRLLDVPRVRGLVRGMGSVLQVQPQSRQTRIETHVRPTEESVELAWREVGRDLAEAMEQVGAGR